MKRAPSDGPPRTRIETEGWLATLALGFPVAVALLVNLESWKAVLGLLLLLAAIFCAYYTGQARGISLTLHHKVVEDVMKEIR